MRVQFFIGMNGNVNQKAEFLDPNVSCVERTRYQLDQQLQLLTEMVKCAAADADATHLAVVCCGEDFFQGAEICTQAEIDGKIGKCMDRDTVYRFIAEALAQLSRAYPAVLIAPGSVYVGVDVEGDGGEYDLNKRRKIKATHFTQNIAPVLFGGELISVVKKGMFLWDRSSHQSILSSEAHEAARGLGHRFDVLRYAEDALDDLNLGLIHLGKTPLPGEEALLADLGVESDYCESHF